MTTNSTKWLVIIGFCGLIIVQGILPAAAQEEKRVFYLSEAAGHPPFSPAILVRDTLYVSGQLAINPQSGQFENGSMSEQAERVIRNIKKLVNKAGLELEDVVQTTVFISDFKEFGEFNEVFRKWFPSRPPTRATVQVAGLARNAKIEIAAVAVRTAAD